MTEQSADSAFERFARNKDTIAASVGTNEATTRMRAIDTVIFEVLGWDKRTVETERYCRGEGYADYALCDESGIALVIEAKKSGKTFVLPNTTFPDKPVGFSLLAEECPSAADAFRQALGYAASLGARYILISNGHQWLLMLTFVPHQAIEERSVFVFESLDAIENKFRLFWDCLNPIGVAVNRPSTALFENRKAPAPAKLSNFIATYPAPATRNEIVNELSTVLGAVWDQVRLDESSESFLKECYVEPAASATSIAQAAELLEQRLSTDERLAARVVDMDGVPDLIQTADHERPIIILGRVGNGKSTFLKYLQKIKAPRVLKKYIQIQIDFLDKPDDPKDVGQFIYNEIEEQLECAYGTILSDDSFVRAALNADLNKFAKSPEGKAFNKDTPEYKREELGFIKEQRADRFHFLRKAIAHIRGSRQFSLAVFLDNLDRRQPKIQEEAYLRASAMARDWSALVFVCLRPTTFYRSKDSGVLDSVAPRIINVVSPKTEFLVSRRLKYAKRYAEGTPLPTPSNRAALSANLSFDLPSVATFLECLAASFRKNHQLTGFFDAISNGNARELLTYVYDMMTSLHLASKKIITKYQSEGGYTMPAHEALRAILYGNYTHYAPDKSLFINLFDVQRADPSEHFTRLAILGYLCSVSEEHPAYGCCHVSELIRYLCHLGYTDDHAHFSLRYLFDRKCCEARDPVEEWSESIKEVRVTRLGKYHIANLIRGFQYVDAVVVDTPIITEAFRRRISDVSHISDRLKRCTMFIDYLDSCSKTIHDVRLSELWRESVQALRQDIRTIQSSIV